MTPDEDLLNQLKFSLFLTDYEAKAYMALVETGALSVAEVGHKSGVPRPKCYEVLNSLLSKGLVSRTMSKPMKYQPLPVEMAFTNRLAQMKEDLEKRAEDADDIRTKISKMEWQPSKKRTYKVIFIEDPQSLFSFMISDTESATKEILIATSRTPVAHHWGDYFSKCFAQVLNRGVVFRFLAHSAEAFLRTVSQRDEVRPYLKGRKIQVQTTNLVHQPFSVIDGKVTYIYLTDVSRREFLLAIRIEDEVFGTHMKTFFDLLWKRGAG